VLDESLKHTTYRSCNYHQFSGKLWYPEYHEYWQSRPYQAQFCFNLTLV